jgi:hypothetical protein
MKSRFACAVASAATSVALVPIFSLALATAFGALTCWPSPAGADTVYYDFASFSAATSNPTTYNFNNTGLYTTPPSTTYPFTAITYPFSGLTLGPATFTPQLPDGSLFILSNDPSNPSSDYYSSPSVQLFLSSQGGDFPAWPDLYVNLSPSTYAIGFDYGSYFNADQITISLNTGVVVPVTLPVSTLNFIGFTSTTPITSVAFADVLAYGGTIDLNDFTIASPVSNTPIPAALPLFAGGLGVIGLIAGRKKRKASAAVAA